MSIRSLSKVVNFAKNYTDDIARAAKKPKVRLGWQPTKKDFMSISESTKKYVTPELEAAARKVEKLIREHELYIKG